MRRIVEPEEKAAGAELRDWIRGGNAILLFASRTPVAADLPEVTGKGPADASPGDAPEIAPGATFGEAVDEIFGADRVRVPGGIDADFAEADESLGVGKVWVTGEWAVAPSEGDRVLLRRGSRVIAFERAVGDGRAIVVADPWFATNVRIANFPENGAFVAAAVARLEGRGEVWFDDRAAGQAASRGLLSLFSEIGLGAALVAGLGLLALAGWRAAVSDAPDRFVRPDAEYHPEQLALQRGDLYADCLTAAEAARIVRDEVARRIGRGDGTGYDRALAMLAARDPGRAARVRGAVDALPNHPAVTPRRHPETWCAAVADVWRALETPPKETA